MAIGRIAGPTLFADLDRQGVDLKFTTADSSLLYLNFADFRVGVNTELPTETLTVAGSLSAAELKFDSGLDGPEITTLGAVTSLKVAPTGNIELAPAGRVSMPNADIAWLSLDNNTISSNSNIALSPFAGSVISTNGAPLTDLPAPVNLTDAANKKYVDDEINGISASQIYTANTSVSTTALDVTVTVDGNLIATFNPTSLDLGDLTITNTDISSATSISLTPGLAGTVDVVSTNALKVPTGTTAQRPATPVPGYVRYNTDAQTFEYYNGTDWVGPEVSVDSQVIQGDGTSQTYSLSHITATNNIIVSINGTLQQPGTAYNVTGASNDQITFNDPLLVTDFAEIRFISLGYTVELTNPPANAQVVTTTSILVGAAPILIDSFPVADYNAASYTFVMSLSDGEVQLTKALLIHNGVTLNLDSTLVSTGGTEVVSYTAEISGGQVYVYAESTVASTLRFQKTYFAA